MKWQVCLILTKRYYREFRVADLDIKNRFSILGECFEEYRGTARGVLCAAFFSTFGVGAYTFALSLKATEIGASVSWLGLAFSGYFMARLVLAPFAGYGADRFGARPLLLAASGIGAMVPFLFCLSSSAEILAVIQVCLGFCGGIIKPVSMGVLGACADQRRRGRLFGAYNRCLYCAFVAGPLVGGAVVGIQEGIGTLTLMLPFLGMAGSFLFFLFSGAPGAGSIPGNDKNRGKVIWRDPGFTALLLAVLGRTMGASVIIAFLPRLISEYGGINSISAGMLFALPNLVIIMAMPVTGRWADMRDRSGLTFLGMGICSACLFGFGHVDSLWGFALLAIIMGFGSALSLPASMSLAADMGQAKGGVMGVFLGVSNLGFVLGPGLAGFAAQAGGIADAFELTALFSAFCLLPTFIIMTKRLHAE